MEKVLVVFYSFEGNTKYIADNLAKEVNADVLELKPISEIKSKGFMKYVWGGSQIMMKKKPPLTPIDIDLNNYETIFIGTPVWAWTYAPPINTFITENKINNKAIALFSCHGGQNGKTFDKLKEALPGNKFLGQKDFFEPLQKDKEENASLARKWAKSILQ